MDPAVERKRLDLVLLDLTALGLNAGSDEGLENSVLTLNGTHLIK